MSDFPLHVAVDPFLIICDYSCSVVNSDYRALIGPNLFPLIYLRNSASPRFSLYKLITGFGCLFKK